MAASPSHKDTSINEECNKPTSSDGRSTVFAVAGDCLSLSCDKARSNCSNVTWLFSYNHTMTVALVEKGKVTSEDNQGRLHVTKECSLEVKKLRKVDGGQYTCRFFPSSGGEVDHAVYDLELMTNTSRPTPTTVKETTSTSKPTTTTVKETTSTSKPTTTTVKGAASSSTAARPSTSTPTTHTLNGAASSIPAARTSAPTPTPNTGGSGLAAGIALGTAVLLIVGLVLLICWLRRRGNKRPKDTTTIGLNSIRDTLPVIGALHDEHLNVDGDQGGGPTYSSIVLPEGQRSVATAQVEDDSSDAVTYASVRASPRCGDKTGDEDVHYATVNKRAK